MKKQLADLLVYSETEMLELFLAFFIFAWGAYLLLPPSSLAIAPAFALALKVMREEWFGIVGVVTGTAHLFFLFTERKLGRRVVLLVETAHWMLILISTMVVTMAAITLPVLGSIILFTALTYIQRGVKK